MNQSAKKKKLTFSKGWSFNPAKPPSTYGYNKTHSFGNSQTQFYLTTSRSNGERKILDCCLHLESNSRKSISGKFSCGSETSSAYEVSFPFTAVIFPGDFYTLGTFHASVLCETYCEVTFEEEDETVISYSTIDHTAKFTSQMATWRLDASLADITLRTTADGRQFSAHKAILAMRSPVFATMFGNGEFKENQTKLVEIEDISGEVMDALLKYIYECNVQGVDKIAADLLVAADKYDLPLLVEECAKSIVSHLTVENAAYFFHFSAFHQLEKLKKIIGKFMAANKAAVRQSDGFGKFIKPDSSLVDQFIDLII